MVPSLCLRKCVNLFDNLLFSIFLPLWLISLCAFQCSGDHRFFLPVNTVSPVHWNAALYVSLQHKMSVLRTLMRRAEVMVTRPDCRTKEMAHIQDSLKTNGYKQWMFKVPKPNQQQSITSIRPKLNVGLSCMLGTSEALTRMAKAHGVGTFNRHIN